VRSEGTTSGARRACAPRLRGGADAAADARRRAAGSVTRPNWCAARLRACSSHQRNTRSARGRRTLSTKAAPGKANIGRAGGRDAGAAFRRRAAASQRAWHGAARLEVLAPSALRRSAGKPSEGVRSVLLIVRRAAAKAVHGRQAGRRRVGWPLRGSERRDGPA
jgi:hypothetical protein